MPSKCLFAEHANYTSMFFPNHAAPSSSATGHQQQHENELEGLNSKETPKPTTNAPRQNGIKLGFMKCKNGNFINLNIFLSTQVRWIIDLDKWINFISLKPGLKFSLSFSGRW